MIRSRLQRFKQKDTRKLIATIMAGKMIGLMSIFGIMKGVSWYFESSAHAAPLVRQAAVNTDQLVSSANTVWVLVTAFLVFFMQAGFMGLEAGFARSRETVNVLLECVFDTCLCGLLYWAIGFAFQF
ncbi:MAG: ammonium transporter, Amt family, partial [Acidimicrobiaceae bacterium]|nr:ammonium transporter, Amt family [Acidimicrobiaceae bacterium]